MRQIVLLRGINIGPRNRIAMPALRSALEEAGFARVRTYVQSGNIVLDGGAAPVEVAGAVAGVITSSFGLDIAVVVRGRDELADVVRANPLADIAHDPKRYQVTFLSTPLEQAVVQSLEEVRAEAERLAVVGREVYAWHPDGVARSKLWAKLGGAALGVTATSRNWTTVTTLLAMADED